jgi:hypothetical protein
VIIAAFDPGRTTGYAIAYRDETHYYVTCGQDRMTHIEFWNFIARLHADHLICESFEYRAFQSDADLYPCELIGVYELWHQMFVGKEAYFQKPSIQGAKKAYFSDAKLKSLDLYNPSFEHGRSALKHLLWWFKFGPGFQFFQSGVKPELVDELWIRKTIDR